MWKTGSKERITKDEMFTRIKEKLRQGYKYELYIGTDSMVHAKSKVVTVVALVNPLINASVSPINNLVPT